MSIKNFNFLGINETNNPVSQSESGYKPLPAWLVIVIAGFLIVTVLTLLKIKFNRERNRIVRNSQMNPATSGHHIEGTIQTDNTTVHSNMSLSANNKTFENTKAKKNPNRSQDDSGPDDRSKVYEKILLEHMAIDDKKKQIVKSHQTIAKKTKKPSISKFPEASTASASNTTESPPTISRTSTPIAAAPLRESLPESDSSTNSPSLQFTPSFSSKSNSRRLRLATVHEEHPLGCIADNLKI